MNTEKTLIEGESRTVLGVSDIYRYELMEVYKSFAILLLIFYIHLCMQAA